MAEMDEIIETLDGVMKTMEDNAYRTIDLKEQISTLKGRDLRGQEKNLLEVIEGAMRINVTISEAFIKTMLAMKRILTFISTSEQQLYIFRRMLKELIVEDHQYDAMRELAWYIGWWFNGYILKKIDREDGVFACYRDLPYIELTEDEAIKFLEGIYVG
jgi:hypothetical protein